MPAPDAPAAPPPDLFLDGAWFDLLWREALAGQRFALDTPAGRLHLMRGGGALAPLGALSNYYSPLWGPQAESAPVGRWADAVAALDRLPGGGRLRLQPLAADAPWLAEFEAALRAGGWRTRRFLAFGNWVHPVADGGFAPYWFQRPAALRHTVERARRRLDKAGGWRVEVVSEPGDALERALQAYGQVYARSWKPAEAATGFVPALVRWAAARGALRLGVLRRGDEPLAAQIWLVHARVAHIFKLAYVQSEARFSPGSVLTTELMRHALDRDRVVMLDYLSGDDAYKADWMSLRRERVGLLAWKPTRPLGAWQAVREALRNTARRFRSVAR